MYKKTINYVVSITSILANIVFIILAINSNCIFEQKEIGGEITLSNTDTLAELFQVLGKADRWFVSSKMHRDIFSDECYVILEIDDNELTFDVSRKNIIEAVRNVIIVMKGGGK